MLCILLCIIITPRHNIKIIYYYHYFIYLISFFNPEKTIQFRKNIILSPNLARQILLLSQKYILYFCAATASFTWSTDTVEYFHDVRFYVNVTNFVRRVKEKDPNSIRSVTHDRASPLQKCLSFYDIFDVPG